MGNEDQGWVAHFLIRALEGQTITLYGDGKRWHGVLYVEDLVDESLCSYVRKCRGSPAKRSLRTSVIRKLQLMVYAEQRR
jgi:CDP-paratose 2-epimerase